MTRNRFAVFCVVTALAAVIVLWGRVRTVEVPHPARWEDPFVVCPGEGVASAALDEAVTWWKEMGHDLEVGCDEWSVSVDVDPALDTRASVEDLAVTHGETHVWAVDGVVAAAEIRVLPGADALVLAHELGHALGYLHPLAPPSGHLLHPSRPGWDGRGLEGP